MDTDPESQGEDKQVNTAGGAHVRNVHVEGGDFVGRDKYVYTRSEREELDDYLVHAVAAYEGEMAQAVLQLPTRFEEPYMFLHAFALGDAGRFFGRDGAIQDLYGRVLQKRLTVVHAKSGAGKTSLLQAGLGPRLIREGLLPVYARAHQVPVQAIQQAITITRHVKKPRPALLSELTLHEFLAMICAHLSRRTQELVLILDQFEEFLIFSPLREHRQPFIDALADCYDDDSLPLRIVLALREDYYSDLDDFEARIPAIFDNEFRLEAMGREDAKAAITGPLTRLEQAVTYEPALLEAVLDDLARGGMELPHLQILCTQLWRELEDGGACLTLASYEALGWAEEILTGYLKAELDKLPRGQGRLAREVLKELVSSEATKRVLPYTVLAARMEAGAEELDPVLAWLVNRHLLHRDEVEGQIRYEMAHEYLIEEIGQWIDPTDLALKQAQELLEREVENWREHRTPIPRDRLELLYAQGKRLRGLDDESWECILVSALEAGYAVEGWASLAGQTGEKTLSTTLDHPWEGIRRAAMRGLGLIWDLPAVSRLGNESRHVRQEAAEALGDLGDTRAMEPLTAALRDQERHVRQAAATALGRLGDPRAVEPLIAALQAENGDVRGAAAGALGELGDTRALEPLIAALGHEDRPVREAAAGALGKLGDTRAVEPLIAALWAEDGNVRGAAAGALGTLGDARALEPLIAALRDRDGDVRQRAAGALGELDDPRAVKPLIAALRDESSGVRRNAAGTLGELGDPRALEPLMAALRDQDEYVRGAAAGALGELGDPRALEPLIAALRDQDWHVRRNAAGALGELGDPRAVEPLIAALWAKGRHVLEAAAGALGKLNGPRAVEPLIAALQAENGDVRQRAAGALGELGDARAVEPLIAALRNEDWNVRQGAAGVLGKLGDPRAVEPLIAALRDQESLVRRGAATALGKLDDPRALEPLIAALRDQVWLVRQEAAVALGKLGDGRALEPLIAALRDEEKLVRGAAAGALGELGDPRAVEPLIAALRDQDADLRRAAAGALGWLGDPRAVDPLIAAFWSGGWHEREMAAEALRRIGTPEALAAFEGWEP